MTVHDVLALYHRPQGPPDAIWLPQDEANRLKWDALPETLGEPFDRTLHHRVYDIPVHVFDLIP